jgi:cell division septum initiation protein DivIVA
VGREPPGPAEQRPTRLEPASTEAATAQSEAFGPRSATPARSRRPVGGGDTRGCLPRELKSKVERGLALFTASTALHCARLELLGGDLATAEAELSRAYDVVAASSEETYLLPPIAELLAEVARGREAGELARAAEGLPAGDPVEPQARWPSVRRAARDWREQADEAEWRARDALELVRIGAGFARAGSWQTRHASGDGGRGASARPVEPARRPVVPAPSLAREGILREILANGNLPDGSARALALELLDVPEELWGAKTTVDPLSDPCWWNGSLARLGPAALGSPGETGLGPGRSGIGHTRPVADDEAPPEGEESKPLPPPEGGGLAAVPARVPAAIRDVSFPSAGRGYERRAVDSYVNQVNRLIAELEVGRSPQAAVRHALDRVGEQTKALLRQARETAEDMTASAREEAEEQLARAQAEAEEITTGARAAEAQAEKIVAKAEGDAGDTLAGARAAADDIIARAQAEAEEALTRARAEAEEVLARSRAEAAERLQRLEEEIASAREHAETRMQELHAETEAVWKERHELLDEIHVMGTRLLEVASRAAARVSPAEASKGATPEAAPAPETESAQA